MTDFKKSNLKYSYSWTAAKENDNARITGFPDNYLLDRNEGYEVLPYINRYMISKNWTLEASFHKIEKAIKMKFTLILGLLLHLVRSFSTFLSLLSFPSSNI